MTSGTGYRPIGLQFLPPELLGLICTELSPHAILNYQSDPRPAMQDLLSLARVVKHPPTLTSVSLRVLYEHHAGKALGWAMEHGDEFATVVQQCRDRGRIMSADRMYDIEMNGVCTDVSALHFAAHNGLVDMVRELLAQPDVDVNVRGEDPYPDQIWLYTDPLIGITPLFCALYQGPQEVARLLMDHGATPNVGRTPPLFSSRTGPRRQVSVEDRSEWTHALHVLVKHDCGEAFLKEMLNRFAFKPSTLDSNGNTLLHWACAHAEGLKNVEQLLRLGIDSNIQGAEGETAIFRLSLHGDNEDALAACVSLVKYGARLDVVNSFNVSALGMAASRGAFKLVATMLDLGGQPNLGIPVPTTVFMLIHGFHDLPVHNAILWYIEQAGSVYNEELALATIECVKNLLRKGAHIRSHMFWKLLEYNLASDVELLDSLKHLVDPNTLDFRSHYARLRRSEWDVSASIEYIQTAFPGVHI
ncbi:hypothetical protein HIM_03503 [Hirsutella minnesotensis 3608]|uniref:Uncharacterized protein n=1 Tax=Hirsutella minnesotensis 3608 TaxID=1043627 RepID=A0A0F8A2R2_9HYPO|nr:hypothetical protein HIM_03503 [Hirsutella minnesotensis 3608]